jgi:DNA-binding transcriptional LysR family regulator
MKPTEIIETDQLRAFDAVASARSFTKAARILGIPQSTLSQKIARLEELDAGEVDIALGKTRVDRKRGEQLWREPLAWGGQPHALDTTSAAIPLLVYLRPSETRDLAEAALLRANRTWTIAAESGNLLGLLAAAEAGLGILPLGRNFISAPLKEISRERNLPAIGEVDYVLDYHSKTSDPAVYLFAELLRSFAKQLVQPAEHTA